MNHSRTVFQIQPPCRRRIKQIVHPVPNHSLILSRSEEDVPLLPCDRGEEVECPIHLFYMEMWHDSHSRLNFGCLIMLVNVYSFLFLGNFKKRHSEYIKDELDNTDMHVVLPVKNVSFFLPVPTIANIK